MSSSRYRSQILSAFSRQSRRLGDRLAQSWRQAKITAAWSAQILLYPVYALYQGTRLVSRQIGQTLQRLPQLGSGSIADPANAPIDELTDRTPAVDLPIVRSLAALSGLELPKLPPILPASGGAMTVTASASIVVVEGLDAEIVSSASATLDRATVQVRGIASLLSDRRLVLTTRHNHLLDVLTAQQQLQLQQRMIWELASYRRLLRLQSSPARLLPPLVNSPHLLPPVRLLRRLVAWVQASPVAIATNLFGEAALPAAPPSITPALPSAPLLRRLSRPWLSVLRDRFRPTPSVPNAIAPAADPMLPTLPSRSWQQQIQQMLRPIASRLESSAIVVAEPSELTTVAPVESSRPSRLQGWRHRRLAAGSTGHTPIVVTGKDRFALPSGGSSRAIRTTSAEIAATALDDRSDDLVTTLSTQTELATPTAAPNWIETEATLVSYVKHPLEQLLEWLDARMLWIETAAAKVWNWLRRR